MLTQMIHYSNTNALDQTRRNIYSLNNSLNKFHGSCHHTHLGHLGGGKKKNQSEKTNVPYLNRTVYKELI